MSELKTSGLWESHSVSACDRCGKALIKGEVGLCNYCDTYLEATYLGKEGKYPYNGFSEVDFRGLYDWITEVRGRGTLA